MNQVAKTQSNSMMTQSDQRGGNEEILRQDVIIPKLLLMQGLSDFVGQRKAQAGDFVRSTNVEKLGDDKTPVEFIPITFTNEWRLEEYINGKYEFRGREPRNAKNEDSPWDFEQNGTKWKRTKTTNVFALLPADIDSEQKEIERAKNENDMFDLNKVLMPVVIAFRSTGYNAGKAVVSHFAKAASMVEYGAKAQGYTLLLKCNQEKNDKGQFYVPEVISTGKRVSKESLEKALKWVTILQSTPVIIDESDEVTTTETASPPRF